MVDFARERPVNVKRLAKTLDVSKDTIRKWRASGLETRTLGKTVITTWEAFDRFANGGQLGAAAEVAESLAAIARR